MNRMFDCFAAVLLTASLVFPAACSNAQDPSSDTAGIKAGRKTIGLQDITEFYWTTASSSFPPDYQRYRFYTEGGAKYFYHETRAGERFPLTEEDITESGTRELSDAEWNEFYTLLCGGTVSNRSEDTSSGDNGPWLYLYWKNDNGTMQEYRFADYGAQQAFEQFCLRLKG